jgi:hypothetical protein
MLLAQRRKRGTQQARAARLAGRGAIVSARHVALSLPPTSKRAPAGTGTTASFSGPLGPRYCKATLAVVRANRVAVIAGCRRFVYAAQRVRLWKDDRRVAASAAKRASSTSLGQDPTDY